MQYIDDRHRYTGTLWEGRYKACPVDNKSYVLRCYRYIELNSLRARMVAMPQDYSWSSFTRNALGVLNPFIQPHPLYLLLGAHLEERCDSYRTFVMHAIPSEELEDVRQHLHQHAYGSKRFRVAIEVQFGRHAGPARIGRPRKSRLPDENATRPLFPPLLNLSQGIGYGTHTRASISAAIDFSRFSQRNFSKRRLPPALR